MFLLDTDHIGLLQLGESDEVRRLRLRMAAYTQSDFYFSIVSFHEQVVGWNNYINRANDSSGVVRAYGMFHGILADFAKQQVAPFEDAAAVQFNVLRRQRVRIGTMDLRIASIALVRDYTFSHET